MRPLTSQYKDEVEHRERVYNGVLYFDVQDRLLVVTLSNLRYVSHGIIQPD